MEGSEGGEVMVGRILRWLLDPGYIHRTVSKYTLDQEPWLVLNYDSNSGPVVGYVQINGIHEVWDKDGIPSFGYDVVINRESVRYCLENNLFPSRKAAEAEVRRRIGYRDDQDRKDKVFHAVIKMIKALDLPDATVEQVVNLFIHCFAHTVDVVSEEAVAKLDQGMKNLEVKEVNYPGLKPGACN